MIDSGPAQRYSSDGVSHASEATTSPLVVPICHPLGIYTDLVLPSAQLAAAFVAANCSSLALLTIHYLVAYKPRRDAVDSVVLKWPRRCFRQLTASVLGTPAGKEPSGFSGIAPSMEGWLRMCLVNIADMQAILGFKLLHELYEAVDAEISAAQWQFLMHLAWFPAIACMCSISVLSPSSATNGRSNAHEWPRLGRAVALAALLGSMLVGIAPTFFFNWEYGRQEASAAAPGADARRFLFDFAGELGRFRGGEGSAASMGQTHGFQLAAFSVVALMSVAILVLGKAIPAPSKEEEKKGCPSQQTKSNDTTVSRWFRVQRGGIHLEDLEDVESSLSLVDARPNPRTFGGILSDAAAFFVRFNLDLLRSRLAEIFLLLVLAWGIARLYGSMPKSDGHIPNGQALWSFSQQLPLALWVVPFVVATNSYLLPVNASRPSSSKYPCIGQSADEKETASQAITSGQQDGDDESTPTEENNTPSYPTPWVGVSLVCRSGFLLVMTFAFFATAFNMLMGFEPQFLVSEALFTRIGVFWVFPLGYPCACFAAGLVAYTMERCWIRKRGGGMVPDATATTDQVGGGEFSKWRVRDYLVLLVFGGAAHAFSVLIVVLLVMGMK
ncbi:uncharacterized protein PG986_000787 [Apiospora aurea]|uniref:Uncharacterized protein n=1 Tax=Apiospora aurea TaxID=335848 RepID=A0ABR1QWQ1_9PEZI